MEARSSHSPYFYDNRRILYLLITMVKKVYHAWKLWFLFSMLTNLFSKLHHLPITSHTNILPKTQLLRLKAYWKPKSMEVEAHGAQTVSIGKAGQRTLQGKRFEAAGIELTYFNKQNINLVWCTLLI